MAGYGNGARQRDQRVRRKQEALNARLAAADSSGERLAAGFDYLRMALKRAPEQQSDVAVDQVLAVMREAGTQLLMSGERNPI